MYGSEPEKGADESTSPAGWKAPAGAERAMREAEFRKEVRKIRRLEAKAKERNEDGDHKTARLLRQTANRIRERINRKTNN